MEILRFSHDLHMNLVTYNNTLWSNLNLVFSICDKDNIPGSGGAAAPFPCQWDWALTRAEAAATGGRAQDSTVTGEIAQGMSIFTPFGQHVACLSNS